MRETLYYKYEIPGGNTEPGNEENIDISLDELEEASTEYRFQYSEIPHLSGEIDYTFRHGEKNFTLAFGSHTYGPLAGISPTSRVYTCYDNSENLTVGANLLCHFKAFERKDNIDIVTSFAEIDLTNESNRYALRLLNHNLQPILSELLGDNKTIYTGIVNNDGRCSVPNELSSIYASNPNSIFAGSIDFNGNITNIDGYLPNKAFATYGEYLLAPKVFSKGSSEYSFSPVSGTCATNAIVTGSTALMVNSLKSNNYDSRWVKLLMKTTSEKYVLNLDVDINTIVGGFQDSFSEEVIFFDDKAISTDDSYGAGILNLHQSLLLAKAYVNNEELRIHIPNKSEGLKKEMLLNKVMFNDSRTHGFSLNRHKMTGYLLPKLDPYSNGGVAYESASKYSHVLNTPQQTQWKKFAKKLVLEDEYLKMMSIDESEIWSAHIPFGNSNRTRNLIELEDFYCSSEADDAICHNRILVNDPTLQECIDQQVIALQRIKLEQFASKTLTKDNFKRQYFELADEDGCGMHTDAIKKGDLVVKRQLEGKSEEYTAFSLRSGVLFNDLRRSLLSDHVYNEEDQFTNNDELDDNEYMDSSDGNRRFLHVGERVVILEKDDGGTSNEEDDVWNELYTLLRNNSTTTHQAHRLLLNANAGIEFVGGTEDEFNSFTPTRSLHTKENECIYSNSNNHELKWSSDSRKLVVHSIDNDIPIYAFDIETNATIICPFPTSGASGIGGQNKLIKHNVQPNISSNEVNYLLSSDKSKISILRENNIEIYENHNGYFTIGNTSSTLPVN